MSTPSDSKPAAAAAAPADSPRPAKEGLAEVTTQMQKWERRGGMHACMCALCACIPSVSCACDRCARATHGICSVRRGLRSPFPSPLLSPQVSKDVKSEITQDGMRIESNWDQVRRTQEKRCNALLAVRVAPCADLSPLVASLLLLPCASL